jgi:DNA polymerase-1
VTGRLSGSKPNLQQLPNPENTDHFIQETRRVYIPEEDHDWGKIDYSQIEVRVLAHFAVGEGAERIRSDFTENPHQDYHTWTASVIDGVSVAEFVSKGEEYWKPRRKVAKSTNFGVMYGMGLSKLMHQLGVNEEQGQRILRDYKQALPFVMTTSNRVKESAERLGRIRTISGRLRRFPERKYAYKALNSLIQGSAADIMKNAMAAAYESGVFSSLPLHLTVHDELDVSIPRTPEGREAFIELKRIMEVTTPMRVPTIAEAETGLNWAEVK